MPSISTSVGVVNECLLYLRGAVVGVESFFRSHRLRMALYQQAQGLLWMFLSLLNAALEQLNAGTLL